MFDLPEQPDQHRYNLQFSTKAGTSSAVAVIFECKRLLVLVGCGNGIRSPRWETAAQVSIGFDQATAWEGENADTRKVVESGQGIGIGPIRIESGALLAPPE